MSRATSIIAKLDKALNVVGGYTGVVYKRTISKSGGDPVTGKGVVVSTIDTRLSPQPAILSLAETGAAYSADYNETLGDVRCIVSPTSISLAQAKDTSVLIVIKSGDTEHEYSIPNINPIVFGGVVVALELTLRSRKR